jgi:hypothetical protein
MNKLAMLLLAGMMFGAMPALADDPAAGIAWESLDEPTRALLAGQEARWNTLPPARQQAIADGARRWLAMDEADRAQARARWQKWRSLTPEQRERLRQGWQRFKALPPEEQAVLRARFQRFMSLPPQQRENLRERWQRMSPEERRRALTRRQGSRPGTLDKRPCPPC